MNASCTAVFVGIRRDTVSRKIVCKIGGALIVDDVAAVPNMRSDCDKDVFGAGVVLSFEQRSGFGDNACPLPAGMQDAERAGFFVVKEDWNAVGNSNDGHNFCIAAHNAVGFRPVRTAAATRFYHPL